MHFWARLPDGADDVAVAAAAAALGVIVFPGRPWFAAEPPAPHLRLSYAASPPDLMDEAVRRLARAIHGGQSH
jgi:DNA-binding transcriptional MocR family regulator